jgi:conjugal transfer pilus assembly protein TraU
MRKTSSRLVVRPGLAAVGFVMACAAITELATIGLLAASVALPEVMLPRIAQIAVMVGRLAIERLALGAVAIGLIVVSGSGMSFAQSRPDCQDGSLLSGAIITNICWNCVFPIRLGGVAFGGSGTVPAGATSQTICVCTDAGLPHPGMTVGMWMPFQVIETVRAPGCSPTMGGIILPGADPLDYGTKGYQQGDDGDASHLHYHSFAFPVFKMLELFSDQHCFSGVLSDFDILFLSEMDPTWTYDDLAFFTSPESAAVALPPAQLACLADSVAALAGSSLDQLFWCAGSWGSIYPMSGNSVGQMSPVSTHSLLATRSLAIQHRRGLAVRTMGDDVLCQGAYEPLMPKSQYRMSMFWPLPEANSDHVIGQTTLVWGDWRQIPAVGEDASFIIWRWQDCCLELM